MSVAAALFWSGVLPLWIPVGVTGSRLHVFVDQHSIQRNGGLLDAVVRMGSPTAITGKIVIVYQTEQFDCAARSWRLVAYEALDASGKVIARKERPAVLPAMLPIERDSLGESTLDTVCFIAKGLK